MSNKDRINELRGDLNAHARGWWKLDKKELDDKKRELQKLLAAAEG